LKKRNIILNINKPCSESWATMEQNEMGNFCFNCSKNVVDFTNLSDQEIIKIITQSTTKICGRLNTSQLNRLMIENQGHIHRSRFYNFFAGLLLIGTTNDTKALDQKNQIEMTSYIDAQKKSLNDLIPNEKILQTDDTSKNVFKGTLIDAGTNEPISFASISIKGNKTGVTSDINGNFKFVIPDSLLNTKYTFRITYIGYETKDYFVKEKDIQVFVKIKMFPNHPIIMGDVQIIEKKK
jgi:hypothetical protein